jgi:DNA-binding transcriptional LysR family regulator
MFYDRDGPRNVRLSYERLFDLRFVLLMPEGHPLARKKRIHPADLIDHPLIVPPDGSYARRKLDQLLHRHDLTERVNIVMETPLLEIIRKYVAGGLGIAPAHIGDEPEPAPGIEVGQFVGEKDSVAAGMVTRKGSHLSDSAQAFADTIRQHLAR